MKDLTFIEAIKKAQLCGGGFVHIMGDKIEYGYEVTASGKVRLASGYSYSETVATLASENWMVTER